MTPTIGTRRVYQPGTKPLLFPGEQAVVERFISLEEMELHRRTGFPFDPLDGGATVTVEPMPGLWGTWLRLRWRLFRGRPTWLLVSFGCNLITMGFALAVLGGVSPPRWVLAFPLTALSLSAYAFISKALRRRKDQHARRTWQV